MITMRTRVGRRRLLASMMAMAMIGPMQPLVLHAADGELDPTFGIGGKVITNFGVFETVNDVAIQPDGRIVVVGFTKAFVKPMFHFVVARYDADGSLDRTFGDGGFVTTGFDEEFGGQGNAVALQSDGKIVAVGTVFQTGGTRDNVAMARYNPNGSLDPTFGTNGIVITDFDKQDDDAQDVVIQRDGRIVVVGATSTRTSPDLALARYNADGSLDATFGDAGRLTTDVDGREDRGHAVAVQPNGDLIAVGSTESAESFADALLVRYHDDGTLDTSFGAGGIVITDAGGDFANDPRGANGIALQADGKIVVAGTFAVKLNSEHAFCAVRYNPDGSLDAGFGVGGKARAIDGFAHDVALQADGRIVVVGRTGGSFVAGTELVVARFDAQGLPDGTFGTEGVVRVGVALTKSPSFAFNEALAVAIQADGKLVAAGLTEAEFPVTPNGFFLVRVTATP